MCLAVNRLAIGVRVYLTGTGLSLMVDAHVMAFPDHFGTHFFKEVTFGASYTYEHKMSSQSYMHELSKGINIESSASYSGAPNVTSLKKCVPK
jgi:hypothetical protein